MSQNQLRGATQPVNPPVLETLIPRLRLAPTAFLPAVVLITIRSALPLYLSPEGIAELHRTPALSEVLTGWHLLDTACVVACWFGPQFAFAFYFLNEPRVRSLIFGLMMIEVVLMGLGLAVLLA